MTMEHLYSYFMHKINLGSRGYHFLVARTIIMFLHVILSLQIRALSATIDRSTTGARPEHDRRKIEHTCNRRRTTGSTTGRGPRRRGGGDGARAGGAGKRGRRRGEERAAARRHGGSTGRRQLTLAPPQPLSRHGSRGLGEVATRVSRRAAKGCIA